MAARSSKEKAESFAAQYSIPAAHGTYEDMAKDANVGKEAAVGDFSQGIGVFSFFFLAFAGYTIRVAGEMNDIAFSSSCLQP